MTTISIEGMSCQHCVAATTKALKDIPGVANVHVDLEKNQASYDGDVDKETVTNAITRIGFKVVE